MNAKHSTLILFVVKKPRKYDVLKRLVEIDASWHGIGLDLGVSNNDLDSLAESNMSDQTKLDHVLQKWIEMDGEVTPVTWQVILDVVKGPLVQNKALAMKIYQELKQENDKEQMGSSKCKYTLNYLMV